MIRLWKRILKVMLITGLVLALLNIILEYITEDSSHHPPNQIKAPDPEQLQLQVNILKNEIDNLKAENNLLRSANPKQLSRISRSNFALSTNQAPTPTIGDVYFYNKMPKSGSTTMHSILVQLSRKNDFNVLLEGGFL